VTPCRKLEVTGTPTRIGSIPWRWHVTGNRGRKQLGQGRSAAKNGKMLVTTADDPGECEIEV
jgi:hypothetical protein